MIFWGALLALAWEFMAPLFRPSQADRLFDRYADWVHVHFNAGTRGHGWLAWLAAALAPALLVAGLGAWFAELAWPVALAWSAAVLYQCLGFRLPFETARQYAERFVAGDVARAEESATRLGIAGGGESFRPVLAALFRFGLARLAGVLFWFIVLGPFGAVAYALTLRLAERWAGEDDFHAVVAQIRPLLDWLPARLLAFSFAIVGNFEDALGGWRSREVDEAGVEAAGLGALGLGRAEPEVGVIGPVLTLFNRVTVLWLGVLGLFWLGGL
ncbi:MAG: regulatory signaling modulator protein AmpE [Pseudomonadota bacterium]